jgi:hypothetical protein
MTTAWASETFEFGGDLVRLTGRGIKEAEYFARVANGCDRVLAEKIFKAMRSVMVKLWAEGSLREEELRRRKAEMERDASLLKLDALPMAELVEIIARSAENFERMVDQLPAGPKRAKAEADLVAWKVRMMPLLDWLGREPERRPVLRRRKLA